MSTTTIKTRTCGNYDYDSCREWSTWNFTSCKANEECRNGICVEKPACMPSWSCTDWSECQESMQYRTCTDLNNCGTEQGKPDEQQACEMPKEEIPIKQCGIPIELIILALLALIGLIVYLIILLRAKKTANEKTEKLVSYARFAGFGFSSLLLIPSAVYLITNSACYTVYLPFALAGMILELVFILSLLKKKIPKPGIAMEEKTEEESMAEKARVFVYEATIKGYNDSQIREMFREKGWKDEIIDKILKI